MVVLKRDLAGACLCELVRIGKRERAIPHALGLDPGAVSKAPDAYSVHLIVNRLTPAFGH